MAARVVSRSYGPAFLQDVPPSPASSGSLDEGSGRRFLSQGVRRLFDSPVLEPTRRALEIGAVQAGISGRTGSYARVAEVSGFSRMLREVAGPREVGALAQAYRRAWGTAPPPPPY